MILQLRNSTPRITLSFLVRFFLVSITFASLFTSVVRADPSTDQTGDAQLTNDVDPPVITTNLSDNQTLTGTVPIIETVYETNPQEYAIKLTDSNGTDLVVNGLPVGVTQNPASGGELQFDWDTTTAMNGTYQVIMSALDQSGNTQTVLVKVVVGNQPTPPTYPPITPELTPIPQQAVPSPYVNTLPKKVSPPTNTQQPTSVLGTKTDDQLAQRLQNTTATIPKTSVPAGQTCATFFGLCWYYSVPATVVMSAAAFGIYRLRSRE